jgi:phospholipase C
MATSSPTRSTGKTISRTISLYFTYARNFLLADHFFSSLTGPNFPNHLYTGGAQSGGAINNPSKRQGRWGCDSPADSRVQVLDDDGDITTQYPCFNFETLADRLRKEHISWKYYAPNQGESGYIWSALDAIRHIRLTDLWQKHVVPTAQFAANARAGKLPAVSWVVMNGDVSEHPSASVCVGESWTVEQLNALMQGPDWRSTSSSLPGTISADSTITFPRRKWTISALARGCRS